MKPTCPSCQNKINSTDIINTNKKGIFIEKQCPSCLEWFGLNKTLEVLKTAVVFRNLCHFSIIKKTGVTHDSIFRLQQSIS